MKKAIDKVQQFLAVWGIWSGCGFVIIGMAAGILGEIVGVQLLTEGHGLDRAATELLLWIVVTSLLIGLIAAVFKGID